MHRNVLHLLLILGATVNGLRIEVGKYNGVSPSEPRLEFFNVFSPDQPPAVMEDPEPENRILNAPGARVPGLQIESVIQAFRYRYPDPPTTPRPNSAAALYPVPPGFPSAYAAPRPDPLPTTPRPQQIIASDGTVLITGNQIDEAQAQAIQLQAQAIQQQRQSQLAQQQLQLSQQRLQQRLLMRERIRQMLLAQQQNDALLQQAQQFADQYPNVLSQQSQVESQLGQPQLNQQGPQTFVQQGPQAQQQDAQPAALQVQIEPRSHSVAGPGVSFSQSYHVSRSLVNH